MKLTNDQILELTQYAFIRMDGAWFLALAKKFGVQTAWEMDVAAWKQLAYLLGKQIRKNYISNPTWPESFLEALEIFSRVLKIEGREVKVNSDTITVRVTDCETQRAIAKAGVADCGIVTVQTYQELTRGLFDKDMGITVEHTKNLNQGDDCCEVVVKKL
jgi:predicted hydrocarbon binding protein